MKNRILLLLLMISSAITSCDDEEVQPTINPLPTVPTTPAAPDTVSPVVNITSPEANATFLTIENVGIRVSITDNVGIDEVRLFMLNSAGDTLNKSDSVLDISDLGLDNDKVFNTTIYLYRQLINLPQNTAAVNYTTILEAVDKKQNTAKSSVTFTIHAPDLNKAEFIKGSSYVNIDHALGWYGYQVPKDPDAAFSFVLLYMVDGDLHLTEAQWIKFATDFNLKDQVWAKWDENGDGTLNVDEFNQGIKKLNFYTEWDIDKNSWIDTHEMAGGIFERWDDNNDKLLSRGEYEDRFYYYYLGER
ncbi:Ig-like domain-containing protein [Pontibacter cellulosilyticus]|uniref:EF-hand domain-containing protein n=1 Tax=Pontibacter cellulosilyticus TaxID=1720253 RepID=A0A923N918_9BACT|nr:Ig-like domain-containing protein [Pontibacter cellulosilyticus]MBC5994444.1 hypothetical protein [Pontibacter cellulosilyticus]